MDRTEQSYHYQVIRRAIEAIDEGGGTAMSLEALAGEVNMSPAHFQRLFSSWVGVSPKRYQQYLTLGHAKTLLAERFTTLKVAQEVGLSGTGRLHDLFLRWEAMSPGEFARKGAGLEISFGWFDGPFGRALAMGTDKGLCGLGFAGECGDQAVMDDLRSRWPLATFREDMSALAPWVNAAFTGRGQTALHLPGPAQIRRVRRSSLGIAGKARHAGLRSGASGRYLEPAASDGSKAFTLSLEEKFPRPNAFAVPDKRTLARQAHA